MKSVIQGAVKIRRIEKIISGFAAQQGLARAGGRVEGAIGHGDFRQGTCPGDDRVGRRQRGFVIAAAAGKLLGLGKHLREGIGIEGMRHPVHDHAAKRQLDKLCAPKQLPKRKEVVAEIQSLISEKNECYNDYREKSDRLHELMTMQRNYQMSMPQPKRGHSHEQER